MGVVGREGEEGVGRPPTVQDGPRAWPGVTGRARLSKIVLVRLGLVKFDIVRLYLARLYLVNCDLVGRLLFGWA